MIVHQLNRQGVRSVTWDSETLEMRIEFFRGQVYAYDCVPESIVSWLARTKDPAGYIQRVITSRFTYRKLGSVGELGSVGTGNARADEAELEANLRASLARLGRDPLSGGQ